ncbi:NAD(P)-dependent oxidoreductase [Acinetobacter sp. ANC 3882]|uniref:NAD-dependent epimerase/dehydratase family protein n=1 Tax=Acinetobacter sp. ANC 3882 TaxID=2923423 RepID=UPI001F4A739C|nr:NAD(P)-dependent oxidoreductase [Acinetobacter sp. ANC 3882]MCH7314267.1 NAD(P)-dependent oxidoreductase [Acinetobacter sp. ANC 3882]
MKSNNSEKSVIFVAGATGAIGYKLCLILKQNKYTVYGMTRSIEKAKFLEAIGVIPVIANIFEAERIKALMNEIDPDVVIHQLTDLPYGLSPEGMKQARINTARIRKEGTYNLIQALKTKSCKLIVQSIAFAYIPNESCYDEQSELDLNSVNPILKLNAEGIYALEQQVLLSGLDHAILRYGKLYGKATGSLPAELCKVNVDAAAHAAYLAIENGEGVYQIVEDDLIYKNIKAKNDLSFDPNYRFYIC